MFGSFPVINIYASFAGFELFSTSVLVQELLGEGVGMGVVRRTD